MQHLKLGKLKFGIRKIGYSMSWTRYSFWNLLTLLVNIGKIHQKMSINLFTQKNKYTLNWGNWNSGFVKLVVRWAERDTKSLFYQASGDPTPILLMPLAIHELWLLQSVHLRSIQCKIFKGFFYLTNIRGRGYFWKDICTVLKIQKKCWSCLWIVPYDNVCFIKIRSKHSSNTLGGFQLLDLIIPKLKSHVIPYKFKCSHWWKIHL